MGKLKRFMNTNLQTGDRLEAVVRQISLEKMIEFERVVWDRGLNSHNDPAAAQRDGLVTTIASGQNQMAFLHELMERHFGDSWVYGGKISVRYIHPVYADDIITAHGTVTGTADAGGQSRIMLEIWCENQHGQKTAAGSAEAAPPLDRMSWLGNDGVTTSARETAR